MSAANVVSVAVYAGALAGVWVVARALREVCGLLRQAWREGPGQVSDGRSERPPTARGGGDSLDA